MQKRVLVTVVASIMVACSTAVAGDGEFAWKVDLKADKEVLVKLPVKDGKLADTRTEEGRQVYKPISVIPIKITVTNTGKRAVKFSANNFDLELLDPRGQLLREHSDYVWKEDRDELRKQSVVLEPEKSRTFTRTILVVHTTLEDRQTYTVECGKPGQADHAKTTFVAKVAGEGGEPIHSDFFDSIVELHGGKTKACGVIFWYDARKKEAYVLTAGTFIGETKEFTAKITCRQGKRLTKPEDHPARVIGSYEGEFAVLVFSLPNKPRYFPLADKGYDYASHPELVCVRWNEKESMTARFVAPRGLARGTLSVYYSEPGNGISGAGLFDRDGRLVGVGWGASSSPHSGRLGLFVSVRNIYPFFEKAKFKLPTRGIIGVTVSAEKDRGGVYLNTVSESGTAAKAGLKPGDIIQAVDGVEVADVDRFIDIIRFSEGCELVLQIRRGEEKMPIKVIVGKEEPDASEKVFTQEKLHKVIVDLIKSKEIELREPIFQEGEEVIRYNLGGFRRNSGEESRSPLEIPVDAQCSVESVRQHFSAKAEQRIWKSHLEKIEKIIEKELRLIAQSKEGKQKLMSALFKLEKESRREFQIAMSEFGKAKMKQAVQFTPTEAAFYKVTITTDPKAAAVFYLTEADYIIYKRMGVEDTYENWKERWIEAANRELLLGGNFRFRARWRGNKIKRTAKVVINKDTPIELAPE